MALNIINDPSLTAQLATGIGEGLTQLATAKAQNLLARQQRQQAASGFAALGLMPEEAQAISQLDPQVQDKILLAYLQRAGGQSQSSPLSASPNESVAQTLARPTSKEQRMLDYQNRKLEQSEKKLANQEKASAFKATAAERKAIIDKAKAARQDLDDLNRLEELEKEGKLDTPGYVEFLKRSGLEIPALMNEGSEEYNKVSQTFIRNAKEYLGSRISNFELEQFLKTIPSLTQSPEGRKRIVANLKKVRRSALAYNEALQEVMRENKGIPPYDLIEQVEEKIGKKLDKIAEKFRQDLSRPVPKGQNKYITALQSGAGTVLGQAPKAIAPLAGAGLGFLAGGPVGAGVGGIAGTLPALFNILGK